ncbi:MAG: histidine phosphatase family protein [bacterium]
MSIRPQKESPGTIDLLRHGATEADYIFRGSVEDPLSERGWQQMEQAVLDRQWDLILTSPLGRCSLFAHSLGEKLACDVVVESRFAEYDFGDWDGMKYDDVMEENAKEVQRFFDDPFAHTPPNAESFSGFHDRVVSAWNHVVEQHGSGTVLVVTHGGVIMSVLAEIMGLQRIHGRIEVPYACLTRIQLSSEGASHRLVSHGSIG